MKETVNQATGASLSMPISYFKGAFVPSHQALISVQTHAFNYGTGCFEGIRVYVDRSSGRSNILQLQAHVCRFLASCKILRIQLPGSGERLCELILELARRNQDGNDFYIRPLAYKSHVRVGIWSADQTDDLTIFSVPFGNYLDVDRGIRVKVSSWTRIPDNATPSRSKCTGIYINTYLARAEAADAGFDEAIFLDGQGHVCEGSAENIFLIRNGKLITPAVGYDLLEGITREGIMTLAQKELGITVEERAVDRSELYVADEIFLCGTGAQVSAVVQVDYARVGSGQMGPVTRQLQDRYFRIVRGQDPAYRHWLTEVPPP